jgi:hypothetical protein
MLAKSKASKAAATSKSAGLGTLSQSQALMGAGAGGGYGMNKPGFLKVQHWAPAANAGGKKDVNVDPSVTATWEHMLDDNSPVTWMLAQYDASGKNITMKGSGPGGLKALTANLTDGVCAWGGFRCYGVDKRGSLVVRRPKIVFVMYKPNGAPAMRKAKMASHKGTLKGEMQGAHMDLTAESHEEFDEQELIVKLQVQHTAYAHHTAYIIRSSDIIYCRRRRGRTSRMGMSSRKECF